MLAERIKEAMQEKGLTMSALARACKVSPAAVAKWLSGETKTVNGDSAYNLCKALDVNQQWLLYGTGFKRGSSVLAFDEDDNLPDSEYVTIPESKIVFSAGPGYEPSLEEITDGGSKAVYKRSWFQSKQVNPEHCARFRVYGDSMAPFINGGDMILVNTHDREVKDNHVYCISVRGDTRVKRLFKNIRGSLIIKSDNPAYAQEELSPDEANELVKIIGRVIDRSGDSNL